MKDPNQNLENSVASKNIDNLYQEIENLNKVNSELNEKIKNLELLVQLNYNLNHTLEKTEILNSVKDFFSTYFYIDEYSLMLKTDSEDKLELVSSLGLQKPNIWAPITRKKSVLNRAFHQNEIVYVPDIASTNPEIIKELGCKQCGSLLTIPLLPEPGRIIGLLNLHRSGKNAFPEQEIEQLKLISHQISQVIDRTILFQNYQELAYSDGLTGVFNRRYFDQRFSREILRARRYSRKLSILMVDIDHFKNFNDTFGHLMGDEVLKVVAKNLEKKLRRADIVCRYGGEEFVIILPEINCNHASIVAEKLRSSIDAFRYKDNNNHEHHITISIGVACFPDHGPDIEGIMESADQALYEAKKCGRNLVRIAC